MKPIGFQLSGETPRLAAACSVRVSESKLGTPVASCASAVACRLSSADAAIEAALRAESSF